MKSVTTDFRSFPEFAGHEMLISLSDADSGLVGYIGIHSTARGPALGGTRFQVYDNPEVALRDALNLSRAMTYKCALANLPYGGGKGVIYIPRGSKHGREKLLTAYAERVHSLGGLFRTGTDVGISDDDVKHMGASTDYMLGLTEADRGNLTTADCAALGVFYAIRATFQQLFGSADFTGRSIAIKGVGKLGGELARLASEAGAYIVAADISEDNLAKLRAKVPQAQIVSTKEISRQPTDVYAPCALGGEFTKKNVKSLRCQAVVGGANNQLVDEAAGQALHARGIIYVPDYIANAGGLIYVADELEPGGFNQTRVRQRVQSIEATVVDMLARSQRELLPPGVIADKIALERVVAGKL